MTEWGVFLVISTVVGFTLSIVGALKKYVSDPINKLDRTLIQTNSKLEVVQDSDKKQNDILSEHASELKDHNLRITVVENTLYLKDK